MKAFLQFGSSATVSPGPFLTLSVPAKRVPLWWQECGLSYTASGYGARLPSQYMVKWEGRWRRVYVACFSNSGTAYIGKPGAWIATVDLDESGQ
jgi:hypothetical protein